MTTSDTSSIADLGMLVDALPDALLVHSHEFIVFVNPAFMQLIRAKRPDELIGHNINEVIHPQYLAGIREQVAIDHETDAPSRPREFVLICRDGSTVAAEGVGRSIVWNNRAAIEVVIRDITDRKRAEDLLSDFQKRLELAERAARMGLWEWDFANETLTWSDEIYRQFGYTRETFAGQVSQFFARIHPDDRSLVDQAVAAVKHGGQSYRVQFRVVMPESDVRWIDSHGVVKPNTTMMIGVAYDVTELKIAQARAEESERNYRLLFNSTAEGIYSVDLDGHCTSCNAAAARMLGYGEASEALGNDMHLLHHHTNRDGTPYPRSECGIYLAFREGQGTHAEDELFFRRDGESFPCEYWSYPVCRNGVIIGSVVTFLDITERKNAEEYLRESEAQYRSIVDNAPYGIYRSAPDGRVLMANPSLVRMLGYDSEEELKKCNFTDEIYWRPEQRAELVAKVLETGSVRDVELAFKRKNGQQITVRHSAIAVRHANGTLNCFQVFVEDISERRVLEKQLWQAQKMEAVGQLAGGVAHDFNNILMVASSYASLIVESGVQDERVLRYAKQIEQAIARGASVTRQLLAFSRKQILEQEQLDLNTVISELNKILPKIMGENIELVTLTAAIPRILADRGQAEQVIMNLAVNARDAMPNGGQLTIATREAQVDSLQAASMPPLSPGNYVILSISDSGIGMDAETKSRIFEPFFTTKERGNGTGLGLATVYGIVKQSNGFIWVDSDLGKGTTFTLYFPALVDRADEPSSTRASSEPQRGSGTILVVEDDPQLRSAMAEYLGSIGYSVLIAGTTTEALRIAATSSRIDALLADLILPGAEGHDMAKTLSSLHPRMQVLYMSGYSDTALKGLGAGSVLLKKPFSLPELATKIAERLGSRQTRMR